MIVTVRMLRRRMAELAAHAASGEPVVILRHGRPYARLRPLRPHERCRTRSISAFRNELRHGLLRTGHRPLRLSHFGTALEVVVEALPADHVLHEEES